VTLGVLQPYLLPYIGYWQLFGAVDRIVFYDNIQYTKKGWINRNRFLRNGTDAWFTVPLKSGSAYLSIAERTIADDFEPGALLRPLASAYRKAPHFADAFPVIESVVAAPSRNLFAYLLHGLETVASHLGIGTPVVVSSTVGIDHGLKAERKVIALCQALGADRYWNPIGGQALYSPAAFAEEGIELGFLRTRPIEYEQFGAPFVPALSIVDVLMFNSLATVRRLLGEYDVLS
jgi:hypothetical protein